MNHLSVKEWETLIKQDWELENRKILYLRTVNEQYVENNEDLQSFVISESGEVDFPISFCLPTIHDTYNEYCIDKKELQTIYNTIGEILNIL